MKLRLFLSTILVASAMGAARASGMLAAVQVGSSTLIESNTGTVNNMSYTGIATASAGAYEFVTELATTFEYSDGIEGNTRGSAGASASYQLYWIGSSPPSTVYAHEFINGVAGAICTMNDWAPGDEWNFIVQSFGGNTNIVGALGYGDSATFEQQTQQSSTASVEFQDLEWTLAHTQPGGTQIYKLQKLLTVSGAGCINKTQVNWEDPGSGSIMASSSASTTFYFELSP